MYKSGRKTSIIFNLCSLINLTPQSHRIVRYLDRVIGCDLVEIRPIGNVCNDLHSDRMLRLRLRLVVSHRTIAGTLGRAINKG